MRLDRVEQETAAASCWLETVAALTIIGVVRDFLLQFEVAAGGVGV